MPEPAFDPDRVREAQDGDEHAWNSLLRRLEPILRGYFIKRIGAKTDVDDLVQNTLVRIHKSLDDLEKPGSLKSFAMKAALFELQDYYRGRYDMKESLHDPDLPLGRSTEPEDRSAHVDVEKALEALTPKARRIMELREYGYLYREIAQMLDTTEAAVKMQVKRAFETMKETLSALLILVWFLGL
ncbi:MAG: sigma-70 family RNA polymerase sigma factor [Bacteroidetes bacterium QS_3_64_15]|nr:MAG: sigma-70 family RNA polymerase sigma factor [Bacteroidetes bacterium QS_3_64_15]